MELTAIIIEDELRARSSLRQMLIEYCPNVRVYAEAGTIQEAKTIISAESPDLVFLDIHLPQEDGFKLFDYFPNPTFEVIFTTAYSTYTLLALKLSAVDYLMKPISIKELKEAVVKAQGRTSNKKMTNNITALKSIIGSNFKKLPLPSGNGYVYVKIEDIIYCEANRNYCNFYLSPDKQILVSKNLKNYESILESFGFMRVNRSYIINLNFVESFSRSNGGEVIMSNATAIPVSANLKQMLLNKLNSYNSA